MIYMMKMTIAPVTDISLKNDKLFGTFNDSVDRSLLPTRLATNPEMILKTPVGCPISVY